MCEEHFINQEWSDFIALYFIFDFAFLQFTFDIMRLHGVTFAVNVITSCPTLSVSV